MIDTKRAQVIIKREFQRVREQNNNEVGGALWAGSVRVLCSHANNVEGPLVPWSSGTGLVTCSHEHIAAAHFDEHTPCCFVCSKSKY